MAKCCNTHNTDDLTNQSINTDEKTILLMGNPNVGKSVFFAKYTGSNVISSNYVGTTVSYTMGSSEFEGVKYNIIDVPGTYSLTEPSCEAERIAIEMLNKINASAIICVLDATYLERNLKFALELKQVNIPVVFALNLADVAAQQGIKIDLDELEKILEAPVVETVAVKGIGLDRVMAEALKFERQESLPTTAIKEVSWREVTEYINRVQRVEQTDKSRLEKFGEAAMKPFPGVPIAIGVLILSMGFVVGVGKALRALLLLPVLNNYIIPFLEDVVSNFADKGTVLFNILVGEYGVLVKGIEWPLALILPYVFLFYVVLSFLEDSGYLPRLAVLMDSLFKKLGLNGSSIIPFIMGYGCAVPAILGTRALTSSKERIILTTLICVSVPCISQTGAFLVLFAGHPLLFLTLVLFSFSLLIGAGLLMNRVIKGEKQLMLLEIPNLLIPNGKALWKKIMARTKSFLIEAELPMIFAILIVAVVAETNFLNAVGELFEPLVVGWLGLPKEVSVALMLGIVRRELAVLPLIDMGLNSVQLLVGGVVALLYIPCLAVVGVLIKEFNVRTGVLITVLTVALAFFFGGLVNQLANLIF